MQIWGHSHYPNLYTPLFSTIEVSLPAVSIALTTHSYNRYSVGLGGSTRLSTATHDYPRRYYLEGCFWSYRLAASCPWPGRTLIARPGAKYDPFPQKKPTFFFFSHIIHTWKGKQRSSTLPTRRRNRIFHLLCFAGTLRFSGSSVANPESVEHSKWIQKWTNPTCTCRVLFVVLKGSMNHPTGRYFLSLIFSS